MPTNCHPDQFLRTSEIIIRVGLLTTRPNRPTVALVSNVATPTPSVTTVMLPGATTSNISFSKNDTEHALVGDDGWGDSSASRRRVTMDITHFYLKDVDYVSGTGSFTPGQLDETVEIIQSCGESIENDEIFVQVYEYLGPTTTPSGHRYKTYQFTATVNNFRKDYNPSDGKIMIQFQIVSRGAVFIGYTVETARITTTPI